MRATNNTVAEIAAPSAGLVTIVVVDDDDFYLAKMKSWLAANPRFACVAFCSDGESALEEMRAKSPSLGIIDHGLPGIKGSEVIWRAKERDARLKTILVSGIPHDGIVFEALDAGADGFLDKENMDCARFLAAVDEVLAGGCPLSERVRKLVVRKYQQYRPNPALVVVLTRQEKEIAELSCLGLADAAIARNLGISLGTVRWHEKNIHLKLNVHCRAELQLKLLHRPSSN